MPQLKKRRGVSNQSNRVIIAAPSRREQSAEKEIDPTHKPKIVQKLKMTKEQNTEKKLAPSSKKGKGPSKYMQEVIRLNFVELINNYDKLQMRKRIDAVFMASKSLIKEVDEEDLEVSTELPVTFHQTEGIINKKLEQLEKLIGGRDVDAISDLHSIQEDSDDQDNAFVHTRQEYVDHVYSTVEYAVILAQIKSHFYKVAKVKKFLLSIIRKKRTQKMEAMSGLVQRFLRGFICWRNVRQELRETRETKYLQML